MDFKDAENMIGSFRKRPRRTLFILIILLVIITGIAYVTGFFSEKGKQHAGSSKESVRVISPSEKVQEQTKNANAPIINQHTEGEQSPAIVSNSVNIYYGAPKGSGLKK